MNNKSMTMKEHMEMTNKSMTMKEHMEMMEKIRNKEKKPPRKIKVKK